MLSGTKIGAIALLVLASPAFGVGKNHYWDVGRQDIPADKCKLKLIEVYQPEGGEQPIHLKIRNDSTGSVQYDVAIKVNGTSAGTIHVDHANKGEISDRDSNTGYSGNLEGSHIGLSVTCDLK